MSSNLFSCAAVARLGSSGAISCATEIAFGRMHMVAADGADSSVTNRPWSPVISITRWLPLLPPAHSQPTSPPAGFALLCRVLAAPLSAFEGVCAVPRTTLFKGAQLAVLSHLGAGGFADALEVVAPDGQPAVLKRPRAPDAAQRANIENEGRILTALPRSSHLPLLVDAESAGAAGGGGAALLLRPVGTALEAQLPPLPLRSSDGAHAAAAAAVAHAECAQLARASTEGILAALRAAHDAGFAHRDVRLSNIIRCRGECVLIDWGNASTLPSDAAASAALRAKDILDAMDLYDDLRAPRWMRGDFEAAEEDAAAVESAARRRSALRCAAQLLHIDCTAYTPWWHSETVGRPRAPPRPARACAASREGRGVALRTQHSASRRRTSVNADTQRQRGID